MNIECTTCDGLGIIGVMKCKASECRNDFDCHDCPHSVNDEECGSCNGTGLIEFATEPDQAKR